MSEENVEIVRRMLEASDRRDGEAVFAAYDPDIEFDMSEVRTIAGMEDANPDFPERLRGRDAVRAALHEWVSAWEIVDYEHEELIDAGIRSFTSSDSASEVGLAASSSRFALMRRCGRFALARSSR